MNFSNLKQFLDSLTDWIVPGNSVLVYQDNKKVFEYSSGYADLEHKIPMSTDKYINLYSCSKVATVTAALQLLEQGKILLSDPLYDYIPEFREMYIKTENGDLKKAQNPITIRHLFTMQAGFSYDMTTPAFQKARELTGGKMDTCTVVKCLAEEPILFEPGEKFNYSLCHDVLAALVETVSGKRFSEYMKDNIFLPLGMEKSTYHLTPEIEANMAEQYRYEVSETDAVKLQRDGTKEMGTVRNVGKGNYLVPGENYDSGGAGIITTPEEYALFVSALANHGLGWNGNRILSANTVELLKQNQLEGRAFESFNWAHLQGYGYGLGVRTMLNPAKAGSNGSVGEFGWGGAAGASVLIDTDYKLGVFYAHHMLNPQEGYYQPRLRNVVYSCLD